MIATTSSGVFDPFKFEIEDLQNSEFPPLLVTTGKLKFGDASFITGDYPRAAFHRLQFSG